MKEKENNPFDEKDEANLKAYLKDKKNKGVLFRHYSLLHPFLRYIQFEQSHVDNVSICPYNMSLLRVFAQNRMVLIASKESWSKHQDEEARLEVDMDILQMMNAHAKVSGRRSLSAYFRFFMGTWVYIIFLALLTYLGFQYSNGGKLANSNLALQQIASITNRKIIYIIIYIFKTVPFFIASYFYHF